MTINNELNILDFLAKLYPLADAASLSSFVDKYYKREEVRKKQLLFQAGDTNTRHYYIEKGLLRLYLIDKNGREFNLLFAVEGQVLGDLATPKATMYYLETVEDSVIYSITNEQMYALNTQVLKDEKDRGIDLMRRSYVFLQKRLVSILSSTAEENYLDLRNNQADLLQRLPQYHIASYLGVSAEFLSKIIARTTRP